MLYIVFKLIPYAAGYRFVFRNLVFWVFSNSGNSAEYFISRFFSPLAQPLY